VLILAFDTSSSGFSIALLEEDKLISKTTISQSGKQSELLVLEIENLLKSQNIRYQNLDLIAATNGPGGFTGTRIGTTCAKTINLAINKNLIFVSTLEVIAFASKKIGKIFTILEAGNDELFIGAFDNNGLDLREISPAQTIQKADLEQYLPQDANFQLVRNSDEIDPYLLGLLALQKFRNKSELINQDTIYLRDPKIGVRKK
jgi:tRNA threonylcarbamoyl adenosine modification protein YeaZ